MARAKGGGSLPLNLPTLRVLLVSAHLVSLSACKTIKAGHSGATLIECLAQLKKPALCLDSLEAQEQEWEPERDQGRGRSWSRTLFSSKP